MSTQTANLGLVKPDLADNADISILNQNADKIDAALPFKFGIENGKHGYYRGQMFTPFGGGSGGGAKDLLFGIDSDTPTIGQVIHSSVYYYSGGNFHIFNGDIAYCVYQTENQRNGYMGFLFNSEVLIEKIHWIGGNYLASNNHDWYLQTTQDGNEWETIQSGYITGVNNNVHKFIELVEQPVTCRGVRLLSCVETTKTGGTNVMIYAFRIFGSIAG